MEPNAAPLQCYVNRVAIVEFAISKSSRIVEAELRPCVTQHSNTGRTIVVQPQTRMREAECFRLTFTVAMAIIVLRLGPSLPCPFVLAVLTNLSIEF